MPQPVFFFEYYLWIGPHVLLGLLLSLFFRRGLHKRLPVFFAFGAFEFLQFIALLTLNLALPPSSKIPYRSALIAGSIISSCLQLAAMYELADDLVLSRSRLTSVMQPLMRWALAGLILIAGITSGLLTIRNAGRVVNLYEAVDFSSSLIQVGLLLTLFLFSRALVISWRSLPIGVAIGFGISGCINLAGAALRAGFGSGSFVQVDIGQMAAFHVAVVVWMVYAVLPERKPMTVPGVNEADLQFWNQEVQRITGP